jgi:hypothetical protein
VQVILTTQPCTRRCTTTMRHGGTLPGRRGKSAFSPRLVVRKCLGEVWRKTRKVRSETTPYVTCPCRSIRDALRRPLCSDLAWVMDAQRPPQPATAQPTTDRRPADRPTADPATQTTRPSTLPGPGGTRRTWAPNPHAQPYTCAGRRCVACGGPGPCKHRPGRPGPNPAWAPRAAPCEVLM